MSYFGVGASLLSAGSELYAGYMKKKSYESSARVNELNARLALLKGESDAARIKKVGAHNVAEIVTGYAHAGVDVKSGSPLVMHSAAASEVELAAQNAMTNARNQAINEMIDADTLRKAGNAAVWGAVGGATVTMLNQLEKSYTINPGPVSNTNLTAPVSTGGAKFKDTGSYFLGGKKERWF